jgi:hypothetical protein
VPFIEGYNDIQLARRIRGSTPWGGSGGIPWDTEFPTVPFDYALTRIEYANGTAGDLSFAARFRMHA